MIVWGYDFQANNFNFDLNGSSNEVTLRSQITPTATVFIPSKVSFRGKEFNVTGIGDNAFRGANLTEVGFCEGLISIGDNAFRDTKLEKIVFPDSHQQLGEYAFADCPNLTYVEFGKGIISSNYWRTLRYTFVNDDNIEKIVFRGNYPPMNLEHTPFSKITRQFCDIYVPLNGYYNFTKEPSEWKNLFSNEIKVYQPKNEKPEIVPYCMYFWSDSKITNKWEIKGSRSYAGSGKIVHVPMSLIIEECPDKHDSRMIRIIYEGELSDRDVDFVDSGTFYNYLQKDSDFTKLDGEMWRIISSYEEPTKSKISIRFKKVKQPGLFKSKYVNGVEISMNGEKASFILDCIPDSLDVKFEE